MPVPSGRIYDTAQDDGNLSRHTRPDGSFVDYAYNSRNLLEAIISDAPPPVAEYTYNARNQLDQTVIENGLFTVECPDDGLGRRVARTSSAGGA